MIKKVGRNEWCIRVSVQDPKKGYPISRQKKFSGSKSDAQLEEINLKKALKAEINGSLTYNHTVSTFKDAIRLYRERLQKRGLSVHWSRKIDLVESELGHLKLDQVPDQFKQVIIHLEGQGKGPATINRRLEIVRAVFNHLVRIEYLDRNPISENRFPKLKEKPRDRYLNKDEQLRLLNAIREHRPYIEPIVRYMLMIPCRISELTEAKRDQYNTFNNTLYFPTSKAKIPIYRPVLDMKDYFDSIPSDCPYLFYWIDRKGNFRKFNNIRKPFQYCVKKAGLTDLRIHDLRHISATDLYESGVSEREIMDLAGWKTTMLSSYRHKNSLKTAQKMQSGIKDQDPETTTNLLQCSNL